MNSYSIAKLSWIFLGLLKFGYGHLSPNLYYIFSSEVVIDEQRSCSICSNKFNYPEIIIESWDKKDLCLHTKCFFDNMENKKLENIYKTFKDNFKYVNGILAPLLTEELTEFERFKRNVILDLFEALCKENKLISFVYTQVYDLSIQEYFYLKALVDSKDYKVCIDRMFVFRKMCKFKHKRFYNYFTKSKNLKIEQIYALARKSENGFVSNLTVVEKLCVLDKLLSSNECDISTKGIALDIFLKDLTHKDYENFSKKNIFTLLKNIISSSLTSSIKIMSSNLAKLNFVLSADETCELIQTFIKFKDVEYYNSLNDLRVLFSFIFLQKSFSADEIMKIIKSFIINKTDEKVEFSIDILSLYLKKERCPKLNFSDITNLIDLHKFGNFDLCTGLFFFIQKSLAKFYNSEMFLILTNKVIETNNIYMIKSFITKLSECQLDPSVIVSIIKQISHLDCFEYMITEFIKLKILQPTNFSDIVSEIGFNWGNSLLNKFVAATSDFIQTQLSQEEFNNLIMWILIYKNYESIFFLIQRIDKDFFKKNMQQSSGMASEIIQSVVNFVKFKKSNYQSIVSAISFILYSSIDTLFNNLLHCAETYEEFEEMLECLYDSEALTKYSKVNALKQVFITLAKKDDLRYFKCLLERNYDSFKKIALIAIMDILTNEQDFKEVISNEIGNDIENILKSTNRFNDLITLTKKYGLKKIMSVNSRKIFEIINSISKEEFLNCLKCLRKTPNQ